MLPCAHLTTGTINARSLDVQERLVRRGLLPGRGELGDEGEIGAGLRAGSD